MSLFAFALSFARRRKEAGDKWPFPWFLTMWLLVALIAFIMEVFGE